MTAYVSANSFLNSDLTSYYADDLSFADEVKKADPAPKDATPEKRMTNAAALIKL